MKNRSFIKKTFVLALVGFMGLVSLSACSSKNKASSKNNDEDKAGNSYSVFTVLNNNHDLKDSLVMKDFEKNNEVKFDFNSVMSTDLVEKRNLLLSSGDYPDIFLKAGFASTDLTKYGKQGVFIPLEKYIKKYAPNLSAKLDEIDGWGYITSGDGHIYSLPEIQGISPANNIYWINQKWLNNLGLKEPRSLDELYTVLKAFKDEDANGNGDKNDEIPITANDVAIPDLLLSYFGITYDYPTQLSVIDGKLTFVPTSNVYKQYVAFITKLYQEGILDKNAFTQKYEQQGAIGKSTDTLGSFFEAAPFVSVGREKDPDYVALTPFDNAKYSNGKQVWEGTLAITDKCKNPENIVKMFDYFYSEKGGIEAWMGLEGKTWQTNKDGNWEWIVGKGYGDDVEAVRSSQMLQGAANHPSIQPDFWFDKMSPEMDPGEAKLNKEREKVTKNGVLALPALTFSEEDSMTLATLKPDITAYINQYAAQVATGKLKLEDSWDNYVKTVDNMGATKLFNIYNKAYKKAIK